MLTACSLLMQVDFYLSFPLLLCVLHPRLPGFRRRLAIACGMLYLAAIIQRFAAVLLLDIGSPISVLAFGNRGKSGGHSAEALRTYEAFQAWVGPDSCRLLWHDEQGLAELSQRMLLRYLST